MNKSVHYTFFLLVMDLSAVNSLYIFYYTVHYSQIHNFFILLFAVLKSIVYSLVFSL